MSYTVLARRYRSSTFDDLIGQEHVARTLKKAIASGRVAHAYLFCGTRGTGKTSTARIFAKCLNCQTSDAPVTEPCDRCNSCQSIARGEDMDVIEIDAASNTGVDNVRDIIMNAGLSPARSRYKIYIIDEVHMLSKGAFNALLKTLEEPPSHVKFILATTEAEKIPNTILSRCQRYDFRNIPTREIAGHLKEICKKEKIKADDDALLMVAKAGAGSMRDALSLLDRLLSLGERELTAEMIEQLLGLPRSQLLFDLAGAIGSGDVKSTLGQVEAIVAGGLSPESLVAALVDHLRNLLVLRTCGKDSTLVEVPGLSLDDLAQQAERFDPVALTQGITILEELRRQLRQSQAGRALLDATLVRLALADQFASIGELLARVDGAPATTRPPARPAGSGRAPQLPVQSPAQAPARPAGEKKKPGEAVGEGPGVGVQGSGKGTELKGTSTAQGTEPSGSIRQGSSQAAAGPIVEPAPEMEEDDDDDLPRPGKVWTGPSLSSLLKSSSTPAAKSTPPSPDAASNVEPVSPDDLTGVWRTLLQLLAKHGPGLHGVLSNGKLISIDAGFAVIRFGPQQETFVKMWERNGKKDLVRNALTEALGQPVGVKFEVDGGASAENGSTEAAPTPAPVPRAPDRTAAPTPQSPASAPAPAVRVTPELVEALRAKEPLVKALMDELGAQIIKVEE